VGDVQRDDGRIIGPGERITLAFNVYPACDGGDGYVVPEAKTACETRERGPRSVDLLMQHITTRLKGQIVPPPAIRVIRL
jgi:hypothetical protein